jgi:hypothetical protein
VLQSECFDRRRSSHKRFAIPPSTLSSIPNVDMVDPDDAAAGGVWVDPPNYFSRIVWPGYVKAHQGIFEDGDVENGRPLSGITLLEPLDGDMTDVFEAACKTIIDVYASTAS